jgi:hypothetical protein
VYTGLHGGAYDLLAVRNDYFLIVRQKPDFMLYLFNPYPPFWAWKVISLSNIPGKCIMTKLFLQSGSFCHKPGRQEPAPGTVD